ncbi:myoglobin-like [Atheta coriaria]|uniref:myoglobin-like n=1 Tax=Dalotia coriaria TaxID=877792 RepID=UPI0031F3BAE1
MGQYESITEGEKQTFLDIWGTISQDLAGYGNALFNVIFTDFPLMANYFPFSGPNDDQFEGHAQAFMREMNKWARNLRDKAALKRDITKLGNSHARLNIRPEEFENLQQCLLRSVRTKMGTHRFGEQQQEAFHKISGLAFRQIVSSSNRTRAADTHTVHTGQTGQTGQTGNTRTSKSKK